MKTTFALVLFFLSISLLYGQEKFLNPCISFGDRIPEIKAYEDALKSKLDAELSPDYLIRFVVKPATSPEYVLQIEKEDGHFKVVTIFFLHNLWNSQNRGIVKTNTFEKSIPREVVSPLDSLLKEITGPSMLNPVYEGGEDGINYLFYYRSSTSTLCGECWSPTTGTPLFELVHIFGQMVAYSNDQKVDLSALVSQITGLNRHIKR